MTGREASAILTLNAGSSSIKVGVFTPDLDVIATGLADRIGGEGALRLRDGAGTDVAVPDGLPQAFGDHAQALDTVLAALGRLMPEMSVATVGHRVVHGGPDFAQPVAIDDAVLARLEALVPFAPLHQPHNLAGIRAARAAFPKARQVACFDTAFHRNHPFVNDTFALPRAFYDKGVRRYGFHGLSYEWIAGALRDLDPILASGRVIVAHLGNGASMCALRDGRSVASTMGFTALDGLPMGTRCGQLDPGVILYLIEQEGMGAAEISDLLYRRSGLLGLSGVSHDMRKLEASDTEGAREAIDYFVFRIQRELGGLTAALRGLDGLIFCGGIGENSRLIRARVAEGMSWLGVAVDPARNEANGPVISPDGAPVRVMVVPTDEEAVIARSARALLDPVEAGQRDGPPVR
jgi:acetate kinase